MRNLHTACAGIEQAGALVDPFGHVWSISTHVEDVSMEEMHRRAKAKMGA